MPGFILPQVDETFQTPPAETYSSRLKTIPRLSRPCQARSQFLRMREIPAEYCPCSRLCGNALSLRECVVPCSLRHASGSGRTREPYCATSQVRDKASPARVLAPQRGEVDGSPEGFPLRSLPKRSFASPRGGYQFSVLSRRFAWGPLEILARKSPFVVIELAELP